MRLLQIFYKTNEVLLIFSTAHPCSYKGLERALDLLSFSGVCGNAS